MDRRQSLRPWRRRRKRCLRAVGADFRVSSGCFGRIGGRASDPGVGTASGALAADLAHGAGSSHEAGVVDAVLELFVTNSEADQLDEALVGGAVPERRLQIPFAARE